jgi:hypothetical protein
VARVGVAYILYHRASDPLRFADTVLELLLVGMKDGIGKSASSKSSNSWWEGHVFVSSMSLPK